MSPGDDLYNAVMAWLVTLVGILVGIVVVTWVVRWAWTHPPSTLIRWLTP